MSASVVVFIFNDAVIKLATEDHAARCRRSACAASSPPCGAGLPCSPRRTGATPRLAHPWVAVRGLLEAVAAISYLVALAYIPFAIATGGQPCRPPCSSRRWRCCC
jgi:hypothetical protein